MKSKEQHWTHLRTLFAILAANGLALNLEKCVFAVSELDFLGHRIFATGVTPLRLNVQVILVFLNQLTVSSPKIFGYDEFLPPFPPRHRQHAPPAHRCTLR